MFFKLAFLSVIAALALVSQPVQAAAIASREDVTVEVDIPEGQDLSQFCSSWHRECVHLAHREGTPYDVCSAGYAGAGTARVDCLAVTSSTTDVNFTDEVVQALGLSYASD